jgi:hypothetical protein
VGQADHERFGKLSYEDFRRMAGNSSLSRYEKIGFPDEYRAGFEELIFADVLAKLPGLDQPGRTVVDIGPGCSDLPRMLIRHSVERGHRLVLVDSEEMLAQLPDGPGVEKRAARYPDCADLLERHAAGVDAILAYSVLQYVFATASVYDFLDRSLGLLAHGGAMLIGDIPNVSKRKRFLASPAGARYHRSYTGSGDPPDVRFNAVEPGLSDDAVVLGLLARARASGCEAYVVPQPDDLPMANRREDVLIRKP